jgi:menaquinone-dependent protoporphyrinogen oxidase
MAKQVLVAYATKYGGTAEIAEKIGETLGQAGLRVDVLPAGNVRDLTPYQAIILGSAVYVGQWRKEAVNLVKANEAALAERPVWLFSSGPTGEGDPVEQLDGWRMPPGLKPTIDRIQPRDVTVFHGVIQTEKLSMLHRWMIKMVKAPSGDFRDWDAIASWAAAIAESLSG